MNEMLKHYWCVSVRLNTEVLPDPKWETKQRAGEIKTIDCDYFFLDWGFAQSRQF